MKFKSYQNIKIKRFLKDNSILLFYNGVNQKAINWVKLEQKLKTINLNYYKVYNKIALTIFNNSIFLNFTNLINGSFFLLTPKNKILLTKKVINKETIEFLKFSLLSIKFNKKVYSIKQIKKLNLFDYKKTVSIFYQFFLVNLKFLKILIKSRNNVT